MAERRMFAKTIIDSDAFLDMPLSTQALYFHLSMRADDDGFVNNPKKIQRMIGASDDDLKVLFAKRFLIPFESGIVVIKHWRIHNYIQKDRYKATTYKEEMAMLDVKENNAYTLRDDVPLPVIEEETSATDMRKKAYEESDLPYSFDYKIRNAFNGKKCPICGCTMTYANNLVKPTIQHNTPISMGGKHELGNISVICNSCNSSIRDNETGDLNAQEVIDVWDELTRTQVVSKLETQVSIGKSKSKGSKEIQSYTDEVKEIVDYLNLKCNTRYRANTDTTKKHINARLNEGFTVADFKQVIDTKVAEWGKDSKMRKFLRPETLFGTKFESYLNQQIQTRREYGENGVTEW